MTKRRDFIIKSGTFAAGTILLPSFTSYKNSKKIGDLGVQLYTFRDEMEINPKETLKKIASLGIKQIESAKSDKGLYYGLGPKEMKDICKDLGMTLRSIGIEPWLKRQNLVKNILSVLLCLLKDKQLIIIRLWQRFLIKQAKIVKKWG